MNVLVNVSLTVLVSRDVLMSVCGHPALTHDGSHLDWIRGLLTRLLPGGHPISAYPSSSLPS